MDEGATFVCAHVGKNGTLRKSEIGLKQKREPYNENVRT
jgi:hypothetical protein|tara:strand:+ start:432 stop:548 length:117 start_codon:yes stop_codon:yes gene_type:complete